MASGFQVQQFQGQAPRQEQINTMQVPYHASSFFGSVLPTLVNAASTLKPMIEGNTQGELEHKRLQDAEFTQWVKRYNESDNPEERTAIKHGGMDYFNGSGREDLGSAIARMMPGQMSTKSEASRKAITSAEGAAQEGLGIQQNPATPRGNVAAPVNTPKIPASTTPPESQRPKADNSSVPPYPQAVQLTQATNKLVTPDVNPLLPDTGVTGNNGKVSPLQNPLKGVGPAAGVNPQPPVENPPIPSPVRLPDTAQPVPGTTQTPKAVQVAKQLRVDPQHVAETPTGDVVGSVHAIATGQLPPAALLSNGPAPGSLPPQVEQQVTQGAQDAFSQIKRYQGYQHSMGLANMYSELAKGETISPATQALLATDTAMATQAFNETAFKTLGVMEPGMNFNNLQIAAMQIADPAWIAKMCKNHPEAMQQFSQDMNFSTGAAGQKFMHELATPIADGFIKNRNFMLQVQKQQEDNLYRWAGINIEQQTSNRAERWQQFNVAHTTFRDALETEHTSGELAELRQRIINARYKMNVDKAEADDKQLNKYQSQVETTMKGIVGMAYNPGEGFKTATSMANQAKYNVDEINKGINQKLREIEAVGKRTSNGAQAIARLEAKGLNITDLLSPSAPPATGNTTAAAPTPKDQAVQAALTLFKDNPEITRLTDDIAKLRENRGQYFTDYQTALGQALKSGALDTSGRPKPSSFLQMGVQRDLEEQIAERRQNPKHTIIPYRPSPALVQVINKMYLDNGTEVSHTVNGKNIWTKDSGGSMVPDRNLWETGLGKPATATPRGHMTIGAPTLWGQLSKKELDTAWEAYQIYGPSEPYYTPPPFLQPKKGP